MFSFEQDGAAKHFYERVLIGREKAILDLEQRKLDGIQPYFPLTDMPTIVALNVVYMTITFGLWKWVEKREKKFQLRKCLVAYNIICVGCSLIVFLGYMQHWLRFGFPKYACNEEIFNESVLDLAAVNWFFYIQKYFEWGKLFSFFRPLAITDLCNALADTWFFILRGSFRQVSFLHVFHHSSVTFVVGYILNHSYRYVALGSMLIHVSPLSFFECVSGDAFMPAFLNSCVHIFMYSYYTLTVLGHKVWWKKYLTIMQIIQFNLILGQNVLSWYVGPKCGIPDHIKALSMFYMTSMLVLFSQFFIRNYKTSRGVIKNRSK